MTFGNCLKETDVESSIEGLLTGMQVTADASGTLTVKVYIKNYHTSALKFKIGLYSNNASNEPATLLASSNEFSATASTTAEYTWTSTYSVTNGTKYWVIVWGQYYNGGKLFLLGGYTAKPNVQDNYSYGSNPPFPNPYPFTGTSFSYCNMDICCSAAAVAVAKQPLMDGLVLVE